MDPLFRKNFDAAQDPRAAANALRLQPGVHVVSLNGAGNPGYVELTEIGDPSAPATDSARLYIRDNAGSSQLVIYFPTGSVQVLATE